MQVLKVTVLAFNPETKRLQLTLANKKDKGQLEAGMAVPEQPGILPGDLLDAEVVGIDRGDEDAITGYTVSLHRQDKVAGSGYLTAAHLCDHPGAEEVLQEGIQVSFKSHYHPPAWILVWPRAIFNLSSPKMVELLVWM